MDLIEVDEESFSRHPWELARANFFLQLIDRLRLSSSATRWLDVGAGDAWFARQLRDHLPSDTKIVCWDVNYDVDDIERETAPGVELTSVRPDGAFDVVLMLDVIEHVADDMDFVQAISRAAMASNAWIIVSVPAYQGLFSDHDRQLKHFRRYSPRACRRLLTSAGLRIHMDGGLFHGLLAVRAVQVALEQIHHPAAQSGVGGWQASPRLTRTLTRILQFEGQMSLFLGLHHSPILPGLSYWACCQRDDAGIA